MEKCNLVRDCASITTPRLMGLGRLCRRGKPGMRRTHRRLFVHFDDILMRFASTTAKRLST